MTTGPRPGSRFDSSTNARAGRLRVRHERRVLDVGDEQDRVEQLVDAGAFGAGHLDDERVAAPLLGHELLLDELLADPLRVGVARSTLVIATMIGTSAALAWLMASTVCGMTPSSAATTSTAMSVACAPRARIAVNASWPGRVDERDRPVVLHDLVRADVLGDAAGLAGDDVRLADAVEQRGLAVVDVAHHGDDRRARLEQALVLFFLFVVAEQRLELELVLLAGLDEQHLGAEGLGDELDHLVGERLRAGDHLARVEQHPHEVGGGAVQLGRELLDRDPARHHDLALGDRRVSRRELRIARRDRGPRSCDDAASCAAVADPADRAGLDPGTRRRPPGTAGTARRATTGTTARERRPPPRPARPGRRRGAAGRGRRRYRGAPRGAGTGRATPGAGRAAAGSDAPPGGGGIGLPEGLRGGAGRRRRSGRDRLAAAGAAAPAFEPGAGAGSRVRRRSSARSGAGSGSPPVERTTRWGGGGGDLGLGPGSATGVGTFAAAGTFSGSASAARAPARARAPRRRARLRMPFESARRRTRSAVGSSMLDEWLFTPILSSLASSSTTAFSTPSSRASS